MIDKRQIREENKMRRMSMTAEEVSAKSRAASENFLRSDAYKGCGTLMLYMPIKNETDTSWVIKIALEDGVKIVFPVTKNGVIIPVYADKNTIFKAGAFCVPEPSNGVEVCAEEIDVVLVPGVAFDKSGARVGFGKGCYDRFLKNTNAVKVGFCYDFQICTGLLPEKHDISMDCIVSESGIFEC